MSEVPLYEGIFSLKWAERPLPYLEEPSYVSAALPTVGPMDYSRAGYSRNPFVVSFAECWKLTTLTRSCRRDVADREVPDVQLEPVQRLVIHLQGTGGG